MFIAVLCIIYHRYSWGLYDIVLAAVVLLTWASFVYTASHLFLSLFVRWVHSFSRRARAANAVTTCTGPFVYKLWPILNRRICLYDVHWAGRPGRSTRYTGKCAKTNVPFDAGVPLLCKISWKTCKADI